MSIRRAGLSMGGTGVAREHKEEAEVVSVNTGLKTSRDLTGGWGKWRVLLQEYSSRKPARSG